MNPFPYSLDNKRYHTYNYFLKTRYHKKVAKVSLDAHFTCPNRDGKLSTGGCIFCGERGSGEHLKCENISNQVKDYFTTYRSERANKFIVYFQNFTNTYDTISNLKSKYDSALIDSRIVGLQIATRPDCINEEVCKLIKSYSDKYYVCVELGLQTSNDITGKLICRGYTSKDFTNAVSILNKYDIDIVAHIMVGLPNESLDDIKNTIDFINNHNIQGLKIHCTYVVENTVLASMYYNGTYTPISLEYYLECAGYILSHINPNIVIHRVSGDAPKDLLVAPDWNSHKKWIMNGLDKYLCENDLWQGKYYNN